MSDAARHRLRLWLRSERALGLTSVAARAPLAPGAMDQDDAAAAELATASEADARETAAYEPVRARPITQALAPSDAPAASVKPGASSLFADERPTNLVMPSPEAPAFEAPPLSPD